MIVIEDPDALAVGCRTACYQEPSFSRGEVATLLIPEWIPQVLWLSSGIKELRIDGMAVAHRKSEYRLYAGRRNIAFLRGVYRLFLLTPDINDYTGGIEFNAEPGHVYRLHTDGILRNGAIRRAWT